MSVFNDRPRVGFVRHGGYFVRIESFPDQQPTRNAMRRVRPRRVVADDPLDRRQRSARLAHARCWAMSGVREEQNEIDTADLEGFPWEDLKTEPAALRTWLDAHTDGQTALALERLNAQFDRSGGTR